MALIFCFISYEGRLQLTLNGPLSA